jgi:hypothetical protein
MLEPKLQGTKPCLFKQPQENVEALSDQNVESSFSVYIHYTNLNGWAMNNAPHCLGCKVWNAGMIINHEFRVIFKYSRNFKVYFNQEYTNPRCQVAQVTKLFVVAFVTGGCCVRNLLYVNIHVLRILRLHLDIFFFGKSVNPILTKLYKFMYINRFLLKGGREM